MILLLIAVLIGMPIFIIYAYNSKEIMETDWVCPDFYVE
jgi:hypothetical protein